MSACVKAVQQPDGSFALLLAPEVTDLSTCQYIVEDGSSTAWRELGNMSIQNAELIGVSVGVVWAIAWGFKQLARVVSSSTSESES